MDQHEKNQSIYEKDVIYRPTLEKDSAYLEIQLGCSYGKCAFCDFVKDEYKVLPLETVKENVQILAKRHPEKQSVFLLGQNTLSNDTDSLLQIFQWIHEYMPGVTEINLYGRVDDILNKGQESMKALKENGLGVIHVGVESGSDRVLKLMNKGITSTDLLEAFQLLDQLQIYYHITYILGLGGKAHWREHVEKTAWLLNQMHPVSIWALALKIWPGTKLHQDFTAGRFEPLTPEEMLLEERLILERLMLTDCLYMDTTALNQYTLIGILPENKESLLTGIDHILGDFDRESFLF